MRLMSNSVLVSLKCRIQDAVQQWFPAEVPFFEDLWPLFEMVLEGPVDTIRPEDFQVCTADEKLATELGFSQEAVYELATPKFIEIFLSAFCHLLHDPQEVSESRIREVLRIYADRCMIPGCRPSRVVDRLVPLLQVDFQKGKPPLIALQLETETFLGLDSGKSPKVQELPMKELDTWRKRGRERWLFLDDMHQQVYIRVGRRRKRFEVDRQARQFLLCLLIHFKIGAVPFETIYDEVWGREVRPLESAFKTALSSMHKQTGGLLKEFIPRVERGSEVVKVKTMPPFCAIWFPRERKP